MNSSNDEQNPATIQAPRDHTPEPIPPTLLEKVQKVEIRLIDQADHRYNTVGDWILEDDGTTLAILVSRMSDARYSWAVAFHEFVESIACLQRGITPQMVDDFDMGDGATLEEPGNDIRAPYHREHLVASALEHKFIVHLGVPFETYDKAVSDQGENNGNENG